jgi:hypothetical protein
MKLHQYSVIVGIAIWILFQIRAITYLTHMCQVWTTNLIKLKEAYPNWIIDTQNFLMILQQVLGYELTV